MDPMIQKKQMFRNRFDIVFDDNLNIKPCGRDATRALIELADEIEPDVVHGNMHTGQMNVHMIRQLYDKL